MNFNGDPCKETIADGDDGDTKTIDLTLRSACCTALMFSAEDERAGLSGSTKVERFLLAQRIFTQDEVTFTAEQISLIKKLSNQVFPTAVVAATHLILDPPV